MRFRVALITLLFGPTLTEAVEPFQDKVLPFVKAYCIECHNPKTTEGELDLTRYLSAEALDLSEGLELLLPPRVSIKKRYSSLSRRR